MAKKLTLALEILLTIFIFLPGINGVDPTYAPQTINDTSGNSADNTSTITWADLPVGEPYKASESSRISAGLEPYYNLLHSFVNSVFIKGIPDDAVEKAIKGDFTYVINNYSEYITYFLGFGICVAVGFLFLLIFPIVACCFCCCRCCCGNCGGKRQQLQKDADSMCRKYTFISILFVSTSFVLVGSICMYINNNNMSTTLNAIPDVTEDNLDDIKTFANNTVQEAKHVISTNFDFLQDALFRDLDNIAYLVGLPLKNDIKNNTNISSTLTTAYSLANSIDTIDAALAAVENNLTALNTSVNALSESLQNVSDTLDDIFDKCNDSCPSSGRPDYSSATVDIDTSAFPDLSSARTSMDSAKGANLTQQISEAEGHLDDIPSTVESDANSTIQSIKTSIGDLTDNLDDILKQIEDVNNMVSGSNAIVDLDSYATKIRDFKSDIEQYDKYRWYGGVGLSGLCLVIVVLATLGMVFGVLGTGIKTPTDERGCVSNCGGIFLMASVGVTFIFLPLLMLLTTLTFIPGAPIHKLVCEPISDLDVMQKYLKMYNDYKVGEGKYWLADLVLQNDTIPLTVTGALKDCRDGKAAFETFKLDNKFDLADLLNYSKTLDVQSEIDGVNVDLTSVDVYPTSLKNQLTDIKDAVNISFADFYAELGANITAANLSGLADQIDIYASSLGNATYQDLLEKQAVELRRIEAEEYAYVQSNVTALNSSIADMEATVSTVPSDVDNLDAGLQTAQDYIQNNGSDVVKSILNTFADRLLGIVDSFVDFTDNTVRHELGSCRPIWNIYNSLLVHTFCYNLMDCYNGFWFSLGWVVFFFLSASIFAVKSAKYFHRTDRSPGDQPPPYPENEKQGFRSASSADMPSRAKFWLKHNKVAHRDTVDN